MAAKGTFLYVTKLNIPVGRLMKNEYIYSKGVQRTSGFLKAEREHFSGWRVTLATG